jgi:hypothetical protein
LTCGNAAAWLLGVAANAPEDELAWQ